jgi:phosphoribosylanthranilate isomerase
VTEPAISISPGSVKICGNRDPELCRIAATVGADLLGFIFVPGAKRYIDPAIAAECIEGAKNALSRRLLSVGVFVNELPGRINEIARIAKVDLVQLHGDEPPEELDQIEAPVLKVIKPNSAIAQAETVELIEAYLSVKNAPVAILVDGYHPSLQGGSGVQADWDVAANLARDYPVMLAGGLTAENVARAIAKVAPLGVDVSSGVESEGRRDPEKIIEFIRTAREGFKLVNHHAEPLKSSSALA